MPCFYIVSLAVWLWLECSPTLVQSDHLDNYYELFYSHSWSLEDKSYWIWWFPDSPSWTTLDCIINIEWSHHEFGSIAVTILVFWSQKGPYWDETVETGKIHIATPLSWLDLNWEPHDTPWSRLVKYKLALKNILLYHLFNSKWVLNSQNEHHVVLKKTKLIWKLFSDIINQVRSNFLRSFNTIGLLFGINGIAPCWPLIRMQV